MDAQDRRRETFPLGSEGFLGRDEKRAAETNLDRRRGGEERRTDPPEVANLATFAARRCW